MTKSYAMINAIIIIPSIIALVVINIIATYIGVYTLRMVIDAIPMISFTFIIHNLKYGARLSYGLPNGEKEVKLYNLLVNIVITYIMLSGVFLAIDLVELSGNDIDAVMVKYAAIITVPITSMVIDRLKKRRV